MTGTAAGLAYDVGMNNGDDSAYYLAKGMRVVGIDANPEACRRCEARFASEIARGRMTVLNVGVSDYSGSAPFYVNPAKDAISTFVPSAFDDKEWAPSEWVAVEVPVTTLSSIIRAHGQPALVKIDVEYVDRLVLKDLLREGIVPPYVSVEAHEIDVYCLLVAMGYERFRLVPGASVSELYTDVPIATAEGARRFSFPLDSSGPFGEDLPGPWLDKSEALTSLLAQGLDWIDVHAAT